MQEWGGTDSSEDKFTLIGTVEAGFVLRHGGVPAHRAKRPTLKTEEQIEAYGRSYARAIRRRLEMWIDWDLEGSQVRVFCTAFRVELFHR